MLTLRKLLQNPSLNLKLVGTDQASDAEGDVLDREFEWLHATDMIDPVPFLGPAEVILTLGWQFPVTHSADPGVSEQQMPAEDVQRIYDDYVALVAAHGVIGIGFGSDVLHAGVPAPLIKACARHGLILFDVPYEISFMDILQEAARVVQRNQSERQARSLRAQKAIANAATRRDGVTATLRETARQLGCGVALFDSLGHPVTVVAAPQGQGVVERELGPIVQKLLVDGQRFRSVQISGEVEAVLQMLGEPGEPSGVLVLTLSQGFDDVSRNVLSSVLALVSVSLEQNQALASLHSTLRQAMLQLLLSGNAAVARQIAGKVWGDLPEPPLVVIAGKSGQFDVSRVMPRLEAQSGGEEWPLFFAQYRDALVLLSTADRTDDALSLLDGFEVTIGYSHADSWNGLELAIEEAHKAAGFAAKRGTSRPPPFGEIWQGGLVDLIDTSDAAHVARRLLGPLASHDLHSGSELVRTLQVWLAHNGKHLPAARELGIHRHTLMHRLGQISQLTLSDLEDYQVRAELTLALRFFRDLQSAQ